MNSYILKGKTQTNILRSSLNMGDNNISNLKDPSDPKDAIPKRFLFKRLQKFADDYKLTEFSEIASENKAAV